MKAELLDLLREVIRVYVMPRTGHMPEWLIEGLKEIEEESED